MAGVNPRERLLNAAIDHIAQRGISDLSLRELASAIGSSHRMLIHHFGGREGLLVAVVQTVEERQRALVVVPDPGASPGDAMRAWWKHISHEALWANERLFFELYGQALQGRPGTVALLEGIIDAWLEPAATIFTQLGFPDGAAAARLGIAVTRGLLLDLLATGEVERVDAAMDVHIAALEALMTQATG
ncbi:TetR/AcrR family transcriptional regulator [Solirubrobacter taibaiensis]|nr:TetR/AcrR family transcriptional regulator [Solirubrobacter taibaiensis]